MNTFSLSKLALRAGLMLCAAAPILMTPKTQAAPGDLDPSFGALGGFTRTPTSSPGNISGSMLQDTSGRFWAAGMNALNTSQHQPILVRYLSNGALDTSFGNAGIWTPANSIVPSIGTIRVLRSGSNFYLLCAGASQIDLFALNASGGAITSFGTNGRLTISVTGAYALVGAAMQGSSIVIAGNSKHPTTNNSDFLLVRVLSNGTLDPTFGTGGRAWSRVYSGVSAFNRLTDVVIQPDNKILAVGRMGPNSSNSNAVVARFLATTGAPDTSFAGTGFSEWSWGGLDRGREIALQSDGKVVFAGTSCAMDGSNCQVRVARLQSNGSLDTSFASAGLFAGNYNYGSQFNDLMIDANNRAIAVGTMTMGDGSLLAMVLRLQSNGAPDSNFAATGVRRYNFTSYSGLYHNSATAVMTDASGIVLAGHVGNTTWNPNAYWLIARVQP